MKKIIFVLFVCGISHTIFAQNLNGLKISSKVNKEQKIKTYRLNYQTVEDDLPSTYSLNKFTPFVGNQGSYGTCVGWSSGYYAMSIINSINKDFTSKSEITKNAMSPIYPYVKARISTVDNGSACDPEEGGTFIPYALKSIMNDGIPFKKDFDVMCATEVPSDIDIQLKIKDYNNLASSNLSNSQKTTNIKSSIANNQPVVIGVGLDNNFKNITQSNPFYVPSTKQVIGFHAMAIIGYDDNKGGGAFQIVNSWGTDWGNKGYFWIRYNDLYAKDGGCWMYDKFGNKRQIINGNGDVRVYDAIPHFYEKKNEVVSIKTKLVLSNSKSNIDLSGSFMHSNLKYGDQIVVNDESIKMYSTAQSYEKNTKYKMNLEIDKPLYVYVLYSDTKNKNGIIFPNLSKNESALLTNSSEQITLPSPKSSFKLQGDVSSDYSIILFSKTEIDPKKIISELNSSKEATISDKLYSILHSRLIEKNDFDLKGNEINGEIEFKNDEVACIIVNINRN